MELDKLIKDLKELKHAGFIDCNIQNILDKLDKVTERVVVDKFIADWYEKNKDMLECNIWYCIKHRSYNNKENNETETFLRWLHNHTNNPVETLVKMKLYGYKVKE